MTHLLLERGRQGRRTKRGDEPTSGCGRARWGEPVLHPSKYMRKGASGERSSDGVEEAPPPLWILQLRQNSKRTDNCASRGSPTPLRRKPSKLNSPGVVSVLMLFLLLKVLNISSLGMILMRSPRWNGLATPK